LTKKYQIIVCQLVLIFRFFWKFKNSFSQF